MVDQTDMEIIKLLSKNSRMQLSEIGEKVHLTGQAVRNRINSLEKQGIIEEYSLKINNSKLGIKVTAFITVYMKTTDHLGLQKYIKDSSTVNEAHRISGEGCYLIKVNMKDQDELIKFLDGILPYGNYKVNLSIENIK